MRKVKETTPKIMDVAKTCDRCHNYFKIHEEKIKALEERIHALERKAEDPGAKKPRLSEDATENNKTTKSTPDSNERDVAGPTEPRQSWQVALLSAAYPLVTMTLTGDPNVRIKLGRTPEGLNATAGSLDPSTDVLTLKDILQIPDKDCAPPNDDLTLEGVLVPEIIDLTDQ